MPPQTAVTQYFGSLDDSFRCLSNAIGKGAARINPYVPFRSHVAKSKDKIYIRVQEVDAAFKRIAADANNQLSNMEAPDKNIAVIFEKAQQYDVRGDVYNAVKLYRRILKLAADWLPPYLKLAAIYKQRREWKPLLHYAKKALALDPSQQDLWWDLGIAAQALGKLRLARTVWSKFGDKNKTTTLISLQLNHSGLFELIWAMALDAVQAQIQSIPHPDSGLHFQDLVLFDRHPVGYQVAKRRRYPVYPEMGLVKRSFYRTYSCILETETTKDIKLLEKLCKEAGLGFEVWSNAARAKTIAGKAEYYDGALISDTAMPLIAIAAKQIDEAQEVLAAWSVIALKSFIHFEDHG